MELREIRRILTTSDSSDWVRLPSNGPLYKNGFAVSTYPDERTSVEVFWHHELAVYAPDVDLTIQWGYDLEPGTRSRDEWHFDWAQRFMNKTVRPFWFDVFWRGSLVDRYALASVDGAHGLVPLPHTAGQDPDWYDAVFEREVAVALLLGDLGSYSGPSNYIAMAGFTVLPDED